MDAPIVAVDIVIAVAIVCAWKHKHNMYRLTLHKTVGATF